MQFLQTLDAAREWEAHKALLLAAEPVPSLVPRAADLPLARAQGNGNLARSGAPATRRGRLPTH